MAGFIGKPSEINRFLGQADEDDSTNLPVGLGSLVRNFDFELTSARTRGGINLEAQGVPAGIHSLYRTPVTGLMGMIYSPESSSESAFQLPLLYQTNDDGLTGSLQGEFAVGSGATTEITSALLPLPAKAHMLGAQAYNNAWMSFSDLITPLGLAGVYNLKLNVLDPYGMKPFGWVWLPSTTVLAGEVCTPPIAGGNGHTYVCTQAGVTQFVATGGTLPVFPTGDGAILNDGTAIWKEHTAVFANALASPAAPVLTPATGGTFAAATKVYIALTLLNEIGETIASIPASITTDSIHTAISVAIPALADLPSWMNQLVAPYNPITVGLFVAVSPTLPPAANYQRYVTGAGFTGGGYPLGSAPILVTAAGTGGSIPLNATARITPGQLPVPVFAPAAVRDAQYTAQWSLAGKPPAGAEEEVSQVNQPVVFPANFAGSSGSCGTNPTSTATFGIDVAGAGGYRHLGTMQISHTGVFSFTSTGGVAVTIYASDTLFIYTPTPQDATLSDVSIFLLGNTTGAFPAARDVYVRQTYLNAAGETPPGPSIAVINTNANDGVLVTVPNPGNYTFTGIGIYEADVPTGDPEPNASAYAQVGVYQPQAVVVIAQTATGQPPPTVNGTGPGGAIAPDTPNGGLNATQGYRYGAIQFLNRNQSLSGFTAASVVKCIVDQAGWQLAAFNVATGPSNIVARYPSLTEADGTIDGPFFAIGNYAPGLPTNFVYPMTQLSAGQPMSATIFADNVTTSGTFNFYDEYLINSDDVTDRLRVIWPYPCVDLYYSKTLDRMIQTGVPGYNGHWISLAADPESYYSDNGFVPTSSASGERAICCRDFRGVTYSLRERSGFTLQIANIDSITGNVEWDAQERWSKVGPCGPRAVDTCAKFMIFVHRSGVYKYDQESPEPELVSGENPHWWQYINWNAGQTVCCSIDEEKKMVRIQLPVGNSTVPNQEYAIFYKDGWGAPNHFSPYSGREVSMPAARRASINDVCAFVGARIERVIPNPPPSDNSDEGIPQLERSFFTSQFLYASSAAGGGVPAITPGIFHDGEGSGLPSVGIDWQYETIAPPSQMAFCKFEGFNLNVRGSGLLFPYVIAGRKQTTDWTPAGPVNAKGIIVVRPIALTPNNLVGDTRVTRSKFGEAWRMRFTGGKIVDSWAELKNCIMYSIPLSSGRPESQKS